MKLRMREAPALGESVANPFQFRIGLCHSEPSMHLGGDVAADVVSHGRYVAFQMAEVAISRHLFRDIRRLIAELRPPPVTSTA